jgi:hypothetical protein
MNYQNLRHALDSVCAACEKLDVSYNPTYEESDLQSVFVTTKDPDTLRELANEVSREFDDDQVYLDTRRVRGGTIISLSVAAINEKEWDKIIDAYYGEIEMKALQERNSFDFLADAKRILESQYKGATAGITRSNQSSRQRNLSSFQMTLGGVQHPTSPKKKSKAKVEVREESVITKRINSTLKLEGLDGMATPTDNQPKDLFQQFGNALKILGDQLGIGPIQDKLKQQGINWKLSADGLSIILYVINATTKAPQALLRIPSEALDEPHELEEQLLNMIDFAKGEAPGALKQQQAMIAAQEKAVRNVVKAFEPEKPDESDVIKSMIDAPAQAAASAGEVKGQPGVQV